MSEQLSRLTKISTQKTKASVVASFDEDKHLLQLLQSRVSRDPRGLNYPEITPGADGAGVRVRRLLQKKLQAGRGTGTQ